MHVHSGNMLVLYFGRNSTIRLNRLSRMKEEMSDNIYLGLIYYNQDAHSIPAQKTYKNVLKITNDHCLPSATRQFQMPGRLLMLHQYGKKNKKLEAVTMVSFRLVNLA